MLAKINKYAAIVSLFVWALTFTPGDNYKRVTSPEPELFSQPLQAPPADTKPIVITRNNYHYLLKPLYDYTINALVVSKMDYSIITGKLGSIFTIDLCLVWGKNVENGLYRAKTIRFSQDCRWVFAEWYEPLAFDMNECSNNHLVIDRRDILKTAKGIQVGDQIRIRGLLVSMDAIPFGKGKTDEGSFSYWKSSTNRSDKGAGACEVIYVKELTVLKRLDPWKVTAHRIALYGMVATVIIGLALFLITPPTVK